MDPREKLTMLWFEQMKCEQAFKRLPLILMKARLKRERLDNMDLTPLHEAMDLMNNTMNEIQCMLA